MFDNITHYARIGLAGGVGWTILLPMVTLSKLRQFVLATSSL